jgi:hypothetical protein
MVIPAKSAGSVTGLVKMSHSWSEMEETSTSAQHSRKRLWNSILSVREKKEDCISLESTQGQQETEKMIAVSGSPAAY